MVLAGENAGDFAVQTRSPPGTFLLWKCWKWMDLGRRRWKSSACNLRKIPFFIIFISLLQVIVYNAADEELRALLSYSSEDKGEAWRYLTYMLLHANAVHLALNVVIQGFLGPPLELEQGCLRCAAVYFGGGLAGSLGASAFATFSSMVGSSGGVYALLISQIPNIVLNYETIKYAAYRIATVAALTASDVIYILCHVYFFNNERPRIGWVAHASGAAAGLLLGFILFNGTSEWKTKLRVTSCLILVLSSVLIIVVSLAPSTLRFLSG